MQLNIRRRKKESSFGQGKKYLQSVTRVFRHWLETVFSAGSGNQNIQMGQAWVLPIAKQICDHYGYLLRYEFREANPLFFYYFLKKNSAFIQYRHVGLPKIFYEIVFNASRSRSEKDLLFDGTGKLLEKINRTF
jgi:hypothetical protein